MNNHLTFGALRRANIARVRLFLNSKGQLAHTDGVMDWSPNDWMTALCGEVGELANLLKKVRRGDFSPAEAHKQISDELADVQIYLDLLAERMDIDLADATASKFNEVSTRQGLPTYL